MCVARRIHYVQLCLLAKIWYVAQVLPLPQAQAQQITTICSWYIWQGAIFRVPITSLYRPKDKGGWDLPHVASKCKTLLYQRLLDRGARDGNVTADLQRHWHVQEALVNPPYAPRIPTKLIHLRHLVRDMAYVVPRTPDETRSHFKRRIYQVLLRLAMNDTPHSEMRVVRKSPLTDWEQVWKKLHASTATEEIVILVQNDTRSNPHQRQTGGHTPH